MICLIKKQANKIIGELRERKLYDDTEILEYLKSLDELRNYKKNQPFIPFDFQWFCDVIESQKLVFLSYLEINNSTYCNLAIPSYIYIICS